MSVNRGLDHNDMPSQSRGFVTIATGNPKYYHLAVNLLHSYRVNGDSSLPFAIICDKDCAESQEFDNVVVIKHPNNSYMDKLSLYQYTPFEETIFIDADSLILGPVDNLWKDFEPMGDFCCYGKVLPLDSQKGWFFYDGMGELKEKLTFNINMHGGIYYLRSTDICRDIFENAIVLADNYFKYKFAHFEKPADEPVLALSMALSNCKPCDRQGRILFLPSVDGKLHITKNSILIYKRDICKVPVLHFSNINTTRYLYKRLVLSVTNKYYDKNSKPNRKECFQLRVKCFVPEVKAVLRRVLKKLLPRKAIVFLKKFFR